MAAIYLESYYGLPLDTSAQGDTRAVKRKVRWRSILASRIDQSMYGSPFVVS
jgi:hypothetical protein